MRKFCRACVMFGLVLSEPVLHMCGLPHVEGVVGMLTPFLSEDE